MSVLLTPYSPVHLRSRFRLRDYSSRERSRQIGSISRDLSKMRGFLRKIEKTSQIAKNPLNRGVCRCDRRLSPSWGWGCRFQRETGPIFLHWFRDPVLCLLTQFFPCVCLCDLVSLRLRHIVSKLSFCHSSNTFCNYYSSDNKYSWGLKNSILREKYFRQTVISLFWGVKLPNNYSR